MKLVSPTVIKNHINKCYANYDPDWPSSGDTRINGFKYHVEHTAGVKLDFTPKQDRYGRNVYEVTQVAVIDDPKFTMWLLRWA
jgi:hypothetical protein